MKNCNATQKTHSETVYGNRMRKLDFLEKRNSSGFSPFFFLKTGSDGHIISFLSLIIEVLNVILYLRLRCHYQLFLRLSYYVAFLKRFPSLLQCVCHGFRLEYLKLNHHNQVQLVQNCETFCTIKVSFAKTLLCKQ